MEFRAYLILNCVIDLSRMPAFTYSESIGFIESLNDLAVFQLSRFGPPVNREDVNTMIIRSLFDIDFVIATKL